MIAESPRSRAAQNWFGYGHWGAPYWFIGMEPGGTDHAELYTSWEACGGGSLIGAKRHEEEWNRRVPIDLQMHHFAEKPEIQKGTWQPLIHILLGFLDSAQDAHLYQRDELGRADGDMALIELSSLASKSLSVPGERRRYESQRIEAIRAHLVDSEPKPIFALFYGTTYREQYSAIAGGSFEADGFRWNGSTLCALITHPARPARTYAYWAEYGRRMRQVVDASRQG